MFELSDRVLNLSNLTGIRHVYNNPPAFSMHRPACIYSCMGCLFWGQDVVK